MLVLTRRIGEAIVLDGGIRIVLTAAKRGVAQIGITAPLRVRVAREELLQNGQRKSFGTKGPSASAS
jgi:carbon storage regulator CsrA